MSHFGSSATFHRINSQLCRSTANFGNQQSSTTNGARGTAADKPITRRRPDGLDPDEDHYQILSGHQRHAAALEAGLEEVPCWVVTQSDEQALMTLVTSNSQGEMDPLEIGIHCLKTVPEGQKGRGKTGGVREYSKLLGKTHSNISAYRRGAAVLREVQNVLPVAHFLGRAGHLDLVSKTPKPTWPILAKALVDDEWSRETTREIVDEVRELAIPASWEKLFLPFPKVVSKLLSNKAFTAAKVSELVQLAEAGSQMVLALCSRDERPASVHPNSGKHPNAGITPACRECGRQMTNSDSLTAKTSRAAENGLPALRVVDAGGWFGVSSRVAVGCVTGRLWSYDRSHRYFTSSKVVNLAIEVS